jgi:hypothetical protein
VYAIYFTYNGTNEDQPRGSNFGRDFTLNVPLVTPTKVQYGFSSHPTTKQLLQHEQHVATIRRLQVRLPTPEALCDANDLTEVAQEIDI